MQIIEVCGPAVNNKEEALVPSSLVFHLAHAIETELQKFPPRERVALEAKLRRELEMRLSQTLAQCDALAMTVILHASTASLERRAA